MSVIELLSRLRRRQIHLWLDGDALRYAARQPGLTPTERRELEQCRDEIVAFLRHSAHARPTPSLAVPAESPRHGDPPLTFEQRRLWVLNRIDPRSSAYNIPGVFRLRGPLSTAALEQALEATVARHDALRSTVGGPETAPVLRVLASMPVTLPIVDLGSLTAAAAATAGAAVVAREIAGPFDLRSGPLFRFRLVRKAPGDHTLILVLHHLVFDGSSLQVFARELCDRYRLFAAGAAAALSAPPTRFADVAWFQHECAQSGAFDEAVEYWRRTLQNAPPLLDLPLDRPRHDGSGGRAGEETIAVGPAALDRLSDLASHHGCTVRTTLLAAFLILLQRYAGQDDFCVGQPVAQRDTPDLEEMVGFLVNMLPIRHDLSGDPAVGELVRRVRDACHAAYAHRDAPAQLVLEGLRLPRSASHAPLFQVVVAFQPAPPPTYDTDALKVELQPFAACTTAKFDLTLFLIERRDGLTAVFEYDSDLFDAATIRSMARHYAWLLDAIAGAPDRRISQIPWPDEEPLIAADRDERAGDEYCAGTLWGLVLAQAKRTPDAVAVLAPGSDPQVFDAVTYAALVARARAIAATLGGAGIGPEQTVGICLDASVARPAILLGILAAGGAYVPLDPRWPQSRIAVVAADAALDFAIADAKHAALVERSGVRCLGVKDLDPSAQVSGDARAHHPPSPFIAGADVAYVLYTSGSTGVPKGVAIEHRSAVAFVRWAAKYFDSAELACVYASTPLCFDLSIFEMFAAWCAGGTVVVSDNILRLTADAAAAPITLIDTVPSAAEALARSGALPPSVLTVSLGGEPLQRRLVDLLYQRPHLRRVVNLYGPAEATTCATAETVARNDGTTPPLGDPIEGTCVYVCDPLLRRVARGAPGELAIGGAGVARGYLNRPDLTAERFVPDPFSATAGARIYRTGDLARHSAGGALRFGGRRDWQVKLRGYRIELGEVDAALHRCAGVASGAATVVSTPAGDRLTAFVVPRSGRLDESRIRRELAGRLPDYMLPEQIVCVDTLPRTATGKIDRLALDAMPRPPAAAARAPRTDLEQTIAEIWRSVLQDDVDVELPFFEMGGNSLHLLEVAARLRERLGRSVPVVDLFRYPSIRRLAQHLSPEIDGPGPGRRAARRGDLRVAAMSAAHATHRRGRPERA
jgi:amino acid adenylation domain-containing protein